MGIYKSKIKNFKKYDVNCFQARSLLPEYIYLRRSPSVVP